MVWQLLCIVVVIVDGSLMLDRPWNPFFFLSTILLLAISNQQSKGKSKKETRNREEEHHPTRDVVCIGQVPQFSPLLLFSIFCSLSHGISCGHFKGILVSFWLSPFLFSFFFNFLVKPFHSLSRYYAAVWSLPPLASQSGRTLQQVQQLVRDPSLFKCSILSKLEDLSETASVVSEIGIYLARLLRVCLVRVVSMYLSPIQRWDPKANRSHC